MMVFSEFENILVRELLLSNLINKSKYLFCFFFWSTIQYGLSPVLKTPEYLPQFCVALGSNTSKINPDQSSSNLCLGHYP